MRIIVVIALIILTSIFTVNICLGQAYKVKTLSASLGAEVLFAESKLSETNKTGGGFSFKGEYVFAEHVSATASSGYYYMPGKNVADIKKHDISAIPLKVGIRYYLGSFYGAGEGGAIFFMGNNNATGFTYSLGLGDKFRIGRNVFDVGLRHEVWHTNANPRAIIGLRIAYELALNQKIKLKNRGV